MKIEKIQKQIREEQSKLKKKIRIAKSKKHEKKLKEKLFKLRHRKAIRIKKFLGKGLRGMGKASYNVAYGLNKLSKSF